MAAAGRRPVPTRQWSPRMGLTLWSELVTISGRLRAHRPRRPCPRRALSIGRQRSFTDNHGRCPCPPSCRIGPNGAVRGCFPSWGRYTFPGSHLPCRPRWYSLMTVTLPGATSGLEPGGDDCGQAGYQGSGDDADCADKGNNNEGEIPGHGYSGRAPSPYWEGEAGPGHRP
jgi:hypothetical protein